MSAAANIWNSSRTRHAVVATLVLIVASITAAQETRAKTATKSNGPVDPIAATVAANPDAFDIPKLVAVQRRAYPTTNSGLTLGVGYLPIDAFNKGFTLGAAYNYNLSDYTSWEVVNFVNSFNIETAIKGDLQAVQVGITGANTPWLDYVNYYLTTGLMYTPLYNKSLLFNKTILHNEFTFVVDGGAAHFQYAGIRPIFGGGLVLRYWLGPTTSLKFDFREQVYFSDTGANGILSLMIGYAFQFGNETSAKN